MSQARYPSLYARLVANTVETDGGCWLWTGRTTHNGYPLFTQRVPGRQTPVKVRAHRAMIEEYFGWHFPHDEAGHLCATPGCIHPDHLEPQAQPLNLSERDAYAACRDDRPWIPVLYPTPARELAELIDNFLDEVLTF